MDEVAASRRRVWFALLLAATFLVALSVGLTATPSSHPLHVATASAATVGHDHVAHRSMTSSTAPDTTVKRSVASTSTTAPARTTTTRESVALTRSSTHVTTHVAAVASTPTTRPAPAPTTTVAPTTTIPVSAAAFLACIRARESHGNYGAVSANGVYRGAYQFSQSSWNTAATHAGRHDLVGVLPNLASPADQDAMALTLYEWLGSSPWGGACS